MTRLQKLVSIGNAPLGGAMSKYEANTICSELGVPELGELYRSKNGFFAFESALHVFPIGEHAMGYTFEQWNKLESWRSLYSGLEDVRFFAEDVFGEQFGLSAGSVVRFDPETGQLSDRWDDIESWSDRILGNYEYETGYEVARDWQKEFGPIPQNHRLLPKMFFILGGQYTVENVYSLEALTGMRLRADISDQLKNIPDGTKVRLVVK